MQRYSKKACNELLRYRRSFRPTGVPQPCDVFINHRGVDTKRNVAGMLYDRLRGHRLRPFLDSKSMKPGDKLFGKIEAAIRGCRVGVAILSPQYCESYFCLHELALMVESKKRVIPVFCDVKPSELAVKDNIFRVYGDNKDMEKFRWALEEAKFTVGITFDTMHGDWSELLTRVTEAVMSNMMEVERDQFIKATCKLNNKTGCQLLQKI